MTKRHLMTVGAVLLVASVGLAACGDDSDSSGTTAAPAQSQSASELDGTVWLLSQITSPSGTTVDAAARDAATLEFAADTVTGSTGCNAFQGSYTVDGDSLTIELGPMTQKACTDAALQAQETALLAAFPEVASYEMGDDGLTLKNADGDTLLTYEPDETALEGTAWTATGVNNGKGGVETTAQTEKLTAEFGPDGQLTGSGGCNTFNAEYTVSGSDGLSIGPVASTKKACEEEVMQTEAAYFAALGNTVTYQLSAGTLTLRDANGATQVSYAAS